jgi:CubicO group peptidase (beta-lactamase class C family)
MIDYQQLEEHIQQYIAPQAILGLAIAIVQGENVIYRKGFGVTSVEDSALPITPKTLFSIGSTSKTLNALLIMRLVEQKILELDRPIVAYLPGFVFTNNPSWGERITLRHLLSHTSGLACGGKAWGPRDAGALRRWVWDEIAHYSLLAEPGRVTYYANGPSVAGHIAEAVTGKPYTQLMAEEVFTPLGMQRSTYDRRVAMTYPLALPHAQDTDGNLFTLHLYADNPAGNPEGFCLSTADDLAQVLIMLLNQGQFQQQPYLHPASVAQMQTIHGDYRAEGISDVRAAMQRYEGLGLGIGNYKGVPVVGHSGMLLGMMTMFDLFPAHGYGVVSIVNYCDVEKRNEMLFHIYDQLVGTPTRYHFPQPPLPSSAGQATVWSQHAGTYLSPYGGLVTIAIKDDSLTFTSNDETQVLTPITANQYYFADENEQRTPVAFLPEAVEPTQFVLVFPDVYRRIAINPDFELTATGLSRYVGLYANYREGNIIDGFYVGVKEGLLTIYPAEDYGPLIALDETRGVPCTALSATRFAAASGLFDFVLAPDGGVVYVTKDLAFRYWPVPDAE